MNPDQPNPAPDLMRECPICHKQYPADQPDPQCCPGRPASEPQWQMLEVLEEKQMGDEWEMRDDGDWEPIGAWHIGLQITKWESEIFRYRRPLTPPVSLHDRVEQAAERMGKDSRDHHGDLSHVDEAILRGQSADAPTPEVKPLQRWEMTEHSRGMQYWQTMEKDEYGDFYRIEDADARIAEKDAELSRAHGLFNTINQALSTARQTIAELTSQRDSALADRSVIYGQLLQAREHHQSALTERDVLVRTNAQHMDALQGAFDQVKELVTKLTTAETELADARRELDGAKAHSEGVDLAMKCWRENSSKLALLFPGVDWNDVDDFIPQVQSIRDQLAAVTRENKSLLTTIDGHVEMETHLSREREDAEKKLSTLQDKIAELEQGGARLAYRLQLIKHDTHNHGNVMRALTMSSADIDCALLAARQPQP